MNDEMNILRAMLDAKGIKWRDKSETFDGFNMARTHFKYAKNIKVSVICGYGSYGGNIGLLEMMIGSEEPIGYLTAEEVMKELESRKW